MAACSRCAPAKEPTEHPRRCPPPNEQSVVIQIGRQFSPSSFFYFREGHAIRRLTIQYQKKDEVTTIRDSYAIVVVFLIWSTSVNVTPQFSKLERNVFKIGKGKHNSVFYAKIYLILRYKIERISKLETGFHLLKLSAGVRLWILRVRVGHPDLMKSLCCTKSWPRRVIDTASLSTLVCYNPSNSGGNLQYHTIKKSNKTPSS